MAPLSEERSLELLAPAGDWAALEAALEAGADAVYFGLTSLNARRGAKNFEPEEFRRAVELVHQRGAKAYLTLNIDLAQRELGQAARMLELARQAGADAVLVRDPALLALRPEYAEIEFHFSTQTCMANSADVAAAGHCGADRVVLARELSLSEIAAASAVEDVETEVFVQGALCFSVSGRCLLASWVGGRSGNRGACTSPCRVPWSVAGEPAGTPLAMHDLAAVDRLDELRRAGVSALKIEGRLKTAQWVGDAAGLYRRAIDGENPQALRQEAEKLGGYTGRQLTSGYLDRERDLLTGPAGREAADDPDAHRPHDLAEVEETGNAGDPQSSDPDGPTYDLEILVEKDSIACRCQCAAYVQAWTMPRTVVRRPKKAVSVAQVFSFLAQSPIQGYRLGRGATDDEQFLLVPRAVNALMDRISAVAHRARKGHSERIHIDLPPHVSELLARKPLSLPNTQALGGTPNRVRVDAAAMDTVLRQVRPEAAIVEGLGKDGLGRALGNSHGVPLIVALPAVFFEKDIAPLQSLIQRCVEAGVPLEVNSWGGWQLARQAGARIEGGPGLGVLNALAAAVLAERGMDCVTLSPEADRRQLEALSDHISVPCSLLVFGRPPLLTTRVRLSEEQMLGRVFEDRRGVRLVPRLERGLWVFRPEQPYDLRGTINPKIRATYLVVDLVGSKDPLADWFDAPSPDDKHQPFRFNYDRALV